MTTGSGNCYHPLYETAFLAIRSADELAARKRALQVARKALELGRPHMIAMQSLDVVQRVVTWASREYFDWFWKCLPKR